MEEGTVLRLKLRLDKLVSVVEGAEALVKDEVPISYEEITRVKISLRNAISAFDQETRTFLDKCGSHPDINIENLMKVQLQAEDVLTSFDTAHSLAAPSISGPTMQYNQPTVSRLPQLELTKYNGNVLLWTEFYDRFEATVGCKPLRDVDKLSYLVESLEGEALDAVAGLNITNTNFAIAMEILKKRYGNTERVIDAHHNALNKLPMASSVASDCRRVYNQFEKHLRVLETLGENVNSNHLRILLLQKFPEEIIYQVHMSSSGNDTVDYLRTILDKVISASEKSSLRLSLNDITNKNKTCTTEVLHQTLPYRPRKQLKRKARYIMNVVENPKKSRLECIFCKGQHYNDRCDRIKSVTARRKYLTGKCFLCLRNGHMIKDCRSTIKCVYCRGVHNRAICPKGLSDDRKTSNHITKKVQEGKNLSSNVNDTYVNQCLMYPNSCLQTAVAEIIANNKFHKCRLLLDSGSQRSYITEKLWKKLKINTIKEDLLLIYTFGSNTPVEKISPSAKIVIITKRKLEKEICVNIVPHITKKIPVSPKHIYASVDIPADDDSKGEEIDILLGNDYYFSFIKDERIQIKDDLYLINSDFGWFLSGHDTTNNNVLTVITYCQCHESSCPYFTEPDLPLRNIDMKSLWALESIGINDSPKSTREEEAVKFFNDTVKYTAGRYEVKWPWIQFPPDLPVNFHLAFGRLKSLHRRLSTDEIEEYRRILDEQLNMGIIEIVDSHTRSQSQAGHKIHYLPHHMICQQGKKGRIVYDASAKGKEQKSLNECMYRGPSMLEDLTALLLKFRCGEIGLIADVEKAFLQVALQEEDRDVTRFLWLQDPTKEVTEENLVHYRFCRVPFGIISSPFLLTATIRYHLSATNASLLKDIADRCYVDNLVTCANNLPEATSLYRTARKTFGELGMNIREWMSNSEAFLAAIPEDVHAPESGQIKVLGLTWDTIGDTLSLKLHKEIFMKQENVTKKDILRTMARVYDPCGFVSPLMLPAKMLFQQLCVLSYKWDSKLPQDLEEKWLNILDQLEAALNVCIPRYIGVEVTGRNVSYELHTFTDASMNAYAAVTYLRIISENECKTAFLMSKTKITPAEDKDDLKIPRLELLAFLIGSRLLKYIKENMDLDIKKQYLWTDSCIVLSWMKTNKLLPPFVAKRIEEIKRNINVQCRYVNTRENPADIATRPGLWNEKRKLWFCGPDYLSLESAMWPKDTVSCAQDVLLSFGEALESTDLTLEPTSEYTANPINEDEGTDTNTRNVCQSGNETQEVKSLQREYFPLEFAGKVTHLSKNLGLYHDVDGVLRSRGRMTNSTCSYETKHPILLPKNCKFTDGIIKSTHEKNYHVGVPHTLSLLRERYWIPQGRAQVQKVVKKCPQCVKHGGGPYQLPPAPSLPAERVNFSTPFSYTGVDYFGPVFVDTECGKQKRWVCLFTCLAVRAIHLEVVKNLTAEECLLALRRFVATRGVPTKIVSDNAQQFKLTSEVLKSPYCKENTILWKFIPQLAPWHGGFYERLVALVKHCMRRTLEKHLLNDNQLLTILKEIESVINTRPLTYVSAEENIILRPADFLTLGKCLVPLPTDTSVVNKDTAAKVNLLASWKRGGMIIEEFQKMFVNQYLPSLRERYSHSPKQPRITSKGSPEVGDLVQIKEDNKKRVNWRVGKISQLIYSQDGLIRVAKVKVGDTEYTRSIGHLYPLEADTGEGEVVRDPMPRLTTMDPHAGPSTAVCDADGISSPRVDEQTPVTVESIKDTVNAIQNPNMTDDGSQLMELETSSVNGDNSNVDETNHINDTSNGEMRPERAAARLARERISKWTRHLMAILH